MLGPRPRDRRHARPRRRRAHRFGITLNLSPTDPALGRSRRRRRRPPRRRPGQPHLPRPAAARATTRPTCSTTCATSPTAPTSRTATTQQHQRADLDFLGINYYFRTVVRKGEDARRPDDLARQRRHRPGRARPARRPRWAGRSIADGLYDILTRVARDYPGVPLYVTENGAAFADDKSDDGAVHDPDRVEYLRRALPRRAARDRRRRRPARLLRVVAAGQLRVGVRLLSKRFGLIHVDYETLERTPKDSAHFYAAGHAGERRAGVVSTRSWPTSRSGAGRAGA